MDRMQRINAQGQLELESAKKTLHHKSAKVPLPIISERDGIEAEQKDGHEEVRSGICSYL